MQKIVLAALVGSMLAPGMSPAEARLVFSRTVAIDLDLVDGCGLVAVEDPTPDGRFGGEDHYVGVLITTYVATSLLPPPNAQCNVWRNGVRVSTGFALVTGPALAVGVSPASFTASDGDDVEVCLTNAPPPRLSQPYCDDVTFVEVPPQEVVDLLDGTVFAALDPIVCPVLSLLSPGVPDVVDIAPDGDISLFGTTEIYDCPPYD